MRGEECEAFGPSSGLTADGVAREPGPLPAARRAHACEAWRRSPRPQAQSGGASRGPRPGPPCAVKSPRGRGRERGSQGWPRAVGQGGGACVWRVGARGSVSPREAGSPGLSLSPCALRSLVSQDPQSACFVSEAFHFKGQLWVCGIYHPLADWGSVKARFLSRLPTRPLFSPLSFRERN